MRNIIILLLSSILLDFGCVQNSDQRKATSQNENINLPDEIFFQVKTENKDDLEIFEDGIIPWVSLKAPEDEIENLIEKDKIILPIDSAILIIDYPLNKPIEVIIKPHSPNGFSREDLIKSISREYNRIYLEEEESAKTKTIPVEKREGIINRNQTNGKYGIWGHDLGDLDLSSIIVHKKRNGLIKLELYIES